MRPEDLPTDATGDALKRIVEDGSDLSKPMDIDFCVSVPNRNSGLRVSHEAEQLGFTTDVSEDDDSGSWTCYCTKTMIPDYSAIRDIEETLDTIAKRYSGHIDGWGSFGNADETTQSES